MVDIARISEDEFGANDTSVPAAEVRRVAEACDVADGVMTLNEQACLQLKYRGLRDAKLWVARSESTDGYDGFALLHGEILDLAVHPDARESGVGTALAAAALAEVSGRVEAWSHADHPGAARIAERFGVPRERELKIMSRPTSLVVDEVQPTEGITVRSFRPEDEAGLLEVNAHAFAHHPEQGHMSHEDFVERTQEAWFDPAGLFVAVDDAGDVLGFHWTKVHRDEAPPYGEVYVVAVNPKAAGRGLGKVLTQVGLSHLGTVDVDHVILYVDGDNDPAIAVYEGQGFGEVRNEVQYRGKPR